VLDLRMVTQWADGAGGFVAALRDRMRNIGGELYVVSESPIPAPGDTRVYPTPDAAIAAAKELRAEHRTRALRGS
jgi:hypothetical protein